MFFWIKNIAGLCRNLDKFMYAKLLSGVQGYIPKFLRQHHKQSQEHPLVPSSSDFTFGSFKSFA